MKITIIADDMPVIHIGNLTSAVEIKKHRSEDVLDHPDGSVTKSKLHEDVLAGLSKNWSQNDETAPDYVKNRTHYTEKQLIMGQVDETFVFENGNDYVNTDVVTYLYNRPEAKIIISVYNGDASIYTLVVEKIATNENGFKMSPLVFDKESVSLDIADLETRIKTFGVDEPLVDTPEYDRVEVRLMAEWEEELETIYPIDEKFIPDTIARTKDVVWNLKDGENNSVYMPDAIPDNLGHGAFAGGYKGQATANYSATGGYGCVVGARGYKILEISKYTSPDDEGATLFNTFIEFTLQNITNLDTNAGSCPQLEEGAEVYVLIKDSVEGWNVQTIGVVDSIDSATNKVIISGYGYIDVDSYTPDIVPLLLLSLSGIDNSPWKVVSTEYANACLGDMFCFGPDAIALTEEQITELTANGIKVGSGARGISTGHFGTVLGKYGISYNNRGRSIGESSKCGGQESWARGGGSDVHGLQCQTLPNARHSFTRGGYNIVYSAFAASLGIGNHVYTSGGLGRGTYGYKDEEGKYLDFIGIGTDDNNRENGYTFDKQGNVWFKGIIKTGGSGYDDDKASSVATIKDLDDYAKSSDIDKIIVEIINTQKEIVGGEL